MNTTKLGLWSTLWLHPFKQRTMEKTEVPLLSIKGYWCVMESKKMISRNKKLYFVTWSYIKALRIEVWCFGHPNTSYTYDLRDIFSKILGKKTKNILYQFKFSAFQRLSDTLDYLSFLRKLKPPELSWFATFIFIFRKNKQRI